MMKLTKTLICLTLVVLVTCRTLEEDEQTIGWGRAEEDEQTIGWGKLKAEEDEQTIGWGKAEEDEQTIGWGRAEEDEQTIGWGKAEAAEGNMKGGVELELVEEEQHFGLGSGEELF